MENRTTSRQQPLCAERLEVLLRRHLRWLRGWLGARLQGVERQDVDDLCQEVLLRAVRGVRGLRDPARFPSWIYRIAGNVLRDHVRKVARKRRETRGVERELLDPRAGTERVDHRDELEHALEAVLTLPARYREPMLLRHVDDLSYEEIGEILGISSGAIHVRISRAREKLRRSPAYGRIRAARPAGPTAGIVDNGSRREAGHHDKAIRVSREALRTSRAPDPTSGGARG